MIKTKLKYLAFGILPFALMSCGGGGSSGTNNGDSSVSLGNLSTGQSVMVSSGNIPVNATQSNMQVGTLSVKGLSNNQVVTFILSNSQQTPSLQFALKNNTSNKTVDTALRCIITAQSPSCTLVSQTAGASNGTYVTQLDYQMTGPDATGSLNPIKYTVNGGTPAPTPVPGTISMSVSAESVSIGGTITATYTLNGASGLSSSVVVTANSSNTKVLNAYNNVNECTLSTNEPTCTVTESGLSAGSAVISSTANGYTIADSPSITVNTNPAPTPVLGTISMSLSAESVNVGGSITATYTLNNSQYVTTPVTIVATPLDPSVLSANDATCTVTTENPSCTITEYGISGGITKLSSSAGGYEIADSNDINVIAHAYITNYDTTGSGYVTMCEVNNTDGMLSNCSIALSDLYQPSDIMFNNGYAYITSRGNSTVTKYSINTDGTLSNGVVFTGFTYPEDITFNNGFVYVGSFVNNLDKCDITSNGDLSNCIKTGNGISVSSGIAFNNGYAYVTDQDRSEVFKCNVSTSNGSLENCANIQTFGRNRKYLSDIVINNGFAYISASYPNIIYKCPILEDGNFGDCTTTGSNLNTPIDVVINNGFAYVTNYLANGAVTQCTIGIDGELNDCATTGDNFTYARGIAIN